MRFIPILLILFLSGCNSKEKKISIFIYNQEDLFISQMTDYIVDELNEDDIINIHDSQNFQITQNEQIEERIKSGGDLFIINPVDRLGVYSIIKKLKKNNIPVIFFNREPLAKDMDLWDKVYYVGTKGEQSAIMQADLIDNRFGNNPHTLNEYDLNGNGIIEAVILKGEQGHQDAEIRTKEVVRSLKSKGYKLDILVTEVANWSRDESYDKMKPILETYKDIIELVICNNDSMAIGAISAMRQFGMFENDRLWVPVVGIDGLEETEQLIKDGYLYGTVLNDSKAQAKAIAELADCILNNQNFNDMSYELIDYKYILVDYQILQ